MKWDKELTEEAISICDKHIAKIDSEIFEMKVLVVLMIVLVALWVWKGWL